LIPLLLGTTVGLFFGYQPVAAVVLGSLLASHTLLAAPIIVRLGETRPEPITITFGATVSAQFVFHHWILWQSRRACHGKGIQNQREANA